jgi:hypothetical protein
MINPPLTAYQKLEIQAEELLREIVVTAFHTDIVDADSWPQTRKRMELADAIVQDGKSILLDWLVRRLLP